MGFLSPEELARLAPAETRAPATPVPTRPVSSGEFVPGPHTARQREVERRLLGMGGDLARRQGMSRRQFFATSAAMAAAFVCMNDVYGPVYAATPVEAATPELAGERASALASQPVIDVHAHFLRDDTRLLNFLRAREALRRIKIPDEIRARHGFAPLGAADGPVKSAILSGNSAAMYGIDAAQLAALATDRLSQARAGYRRAGGERGNLAYGYVAR